MWHELRILKDDGPFDVNLCVVATVLLVMVTLLSACSSLGGASDGWRVNSFKDPDTVWAAIELALLELDYEIVTSNRPDGVIRAESRRTDDGTVIALAIDQVVRTDDQVSVYVKPSFAGNGGSSDPDLLKAAADAFVKHLESTLNG
jgi:hypothetical protein